VTAVTGHWSQLKTRQTTASESCHLTWARWHPDGALSDEPGEAVSAWHCFQHCCAQHTPDEVVQLHAGSWWVAGVWLDGLWAAVTGKGFLLFGLPSPHRVSRSERLSRPVVRSHDPPSSVALHYRGCCVCVAACPLLRGVLACAIQTWPAAGGMADHAQRRQELWGSSSPH
jgi:hypothetical protein